MSSTFRIIVTIFALAALASALPLRRDAPGSLATVASGDGVHSTTRTSCATNYHGASTDAIFDDCHVESQEISLTVTFPDEFMVHTAMSTLLGTSGTITPSNHNTTPDLVISTIVDSAWTTLTDDISYVDAGDGSVAAAAHTIAHSASESMASITSALPDTFILQASVYSAEPMDVVYSTSRGVAPYSITETAPSSPTAILAQDTGDAPALKYVGLVGGGGLFLALAALALCVYWANRKDSAAKRLGPANHNSHALALRLISKPYLKEDFDHSDTSSYQTTAASVRLARLAMTLENHFKVVPTAPSTQLVGAGAVIVNLIHPTPTNSLYIPYIPEPDKVHLHP